MPKTYNGLWDDFVSFSNLYKGYEIARSGGHREDTQVIKYTRELEPNLINLQNHLIWGSWRPDPVYSFLVFEPKERLIQAPSFRDRIVHHSYYRTAGPLFENKMIDQTYACLKGRGPLGAVLQLKEYLQDYPEGSKVYAIKGDVSKFFPSISHSHLSDQVRRTISDKRLLAVSDLLVEQNDQEQGLYIGSLPSQLYAGVTLTPFDHHMKDDLGIKHYVRYMDDFIILSDDLDGLRATMRDAICSLGSVGLRINPKSKVIPLTHGVDFCGYRTFRDHMLPRKRNVRNARKRLIRLIEQYDNGLAEISDIRASLTSFMGYASHCDAYRTTQRLLSELIIKPRHTSLTVAGSTDENHLVPYGLRYQDGEQRRA